MRISLGTITSFLLLRDSLSIRDPSVADQLQGLMTDSRFGACANDATNPECMQVREEAEQKIVLQQNIIDTDIVTNKAYMESLRGELIAKVDELKKMNDTLQGSMFAPGLVEQFEALSYGLTELETLMDGANDGITNEVAKRGSLYSQALTTVATAQKESAKSAQNAMTKLANSNLFAQSAQIRAIQNMFGRSLADLGSQTSNMLSDNQDRLTDLTKDISDSTEGAMQELGVIAESASYAREDAKAVAASGNATFKAAEAKLFQTAQAQLDIYKKYADTLIAAAKKDTNSTLTNAIRDISDKIVGLRGDLIQQFSDNTDAVFQNITKLKDAAGSIVPDAIKTGQDLTDRANVKVGAAQSAATSATQSISRLTSDTAQMLQDLMAQIRAISQTSQDSQGQAKTKLDDQYSEIDQRTQTLSSDMVSGVNEELANMEGQIQSTKEQTSAQTQESKDELVEKLAGIDADSGESSLVALNAVSDATAAANTLNGLNAARLKTVTDTHRAALQDASNSVSGALQNAAETSEELDTEAGQKNRALEMQAGQTVADSSAQNTRTVNALNQKVDGDFQDVADSTHRSQQLSLAQLGDLKAALNALSSGSSAVDSKTKDLEAMLREMGSDQIAKMQQLLSQLDSSQSAIDSTSSAAQSQITAQITDLLGGRMNALNNQLNQNAAGVNSDLNAATDDIRKTTEGIKKSSTSLDGDFQKTDSDMNALLATLDGAGVGMSSSAASLQALLSSMTDREVVEFKMKIRQLGSDSSDSQGKLRAYLSAMIQEKTDKAKVDAESVFLANQKALTEALNSASDEISKTKSLAGLALVDNQIVTANSSKLFNDFIETEEKLSNASDAHTVVLNELQQNITDWKSTIVDRINQIQAQVAQGAAALPTYAQDRLTNISTIITMSQDDLKGFLAQFQDALDRAKAIQDHFQDSQSGRIISAMTGVSQAITTASIRMASQVAQSDMNANDKAKALTKILSELCDSIDEANANAGKDDDAITARIRSMSSQVNGTVDSISQQVNQMVTGLATDKLNKDISLANNMQQAVTDAGVGINASANSIELAQEAIHRAAEKSSAGWADNSKKVYTLGGFLFSLSQQSQQKLLYILQQLQHGRLSMDQALALARQADISQIKSAQDVVSVLVGAMDGYDETVQSIFGNSFDRLENATVGLSSRVDSMVGDLVTLAAVLDFNSSMLAHRVDRFANISNDFITTSQNNVSDLETYIYNQQAEVTHAMATLNSLLDYSEKDVNLRQQQFDNWIDSLIKSETSVIATKTSALKTALLGGQKASSFAQMDDKKQLAKHNIEVLKAEMVELERRRNLRRQTHHRSIQQD
jgi:hypothetical protein